MMRWVAQVSHRTSTVPSTRQPSNSGALLHRPSRKKAIVLLKKWGLLAVMVVLCLCFITRSPVTAQGTAHVRFAHFIYKGPQVNILADDKAITDESKLPYVLNTFELSKFYVDLSADTPHTFTVVPVGKTPDAALFKAQSFTLTDAHNYTLVLIGNVDGKDLQFSLVDETLALAPYDLKASAVTIVFDNVEGMPALDLYWAGKPIVTNIVYGQYIIVQDQPEGKGSKFTPHGDPKTVLFEYADAIGGPAQTIAFFGLAGKYPGTLGQDYDTPYVGSYIGTPITRDSGSIAVGDVVKVSMAELGVRY